MPKKQIQLAITTKKEDDFADWYGQILNKAELIDNHDVSGCYVLRSNAYQIWEFIQQHLDKQFKKDGVRNAYFPLFIAKSALEKEAEHLSDFSPEVAWVTKAGDKPLEREIAIRPTSETSMYPYFAKWLQSYRDLPMKINQWNNIVRWEFKCPTPFIRSREFLWQEGHTAHAIKDEAEKQVTRSLKVYEDFYRNVLNMDVIPGMKTPKEKFAGADYTLTVEAFIPEVGRGIQAATSHMLGQNFAKMFNIIYEHPESKEKEHVYQTSWGLTTRSIGTMIMSHSDNVGLVLPPAVAFYQVVIVPTGLNKKTPEEVKEKLKQKCDEMNQYLNNETDIRCHADLRDHYTPPWKYNYWELRGVPLRIELGPRELDEKKCTFVNRITGEKTTEEIPSTEVFHQKINQYLKSIGEMLLEKSKKNLKESIHIVTSWDNMTPVLKENKMFALPFCKEAECETSLKKQFTELGEECAGVKSLCTPFDQSLLNLKDYPVKCVNPKCEKECKSYTLFGKSY